MALDALNDRLRNELTEKPHKIAYKDWSVSLQQLVIAKLILSALDDPLPVGSFYCDPLPPYQADINNTEIRLYNGMLSIGSVYHKPNTEAGLIFDAFSAVIPQEVTRLQKEREVQQNDPRGPQQDD